MNKKNIKFRPRTGIKFGGRSEPNSIVGSFGGATVDYASMTGAIDVYAEKLDGSIIGADATGIRVSSSVDLEGSISFGRHHVRAMHREILLGADHGYSGVGSGSSYLNQPVSASSPSWTRAYLGPGKNQSGVITVLSASDHEVSVLNAYRTGLEAAEVSPVPLSQSLYYSKKTSFQSVIVKLTSSSPQGIFDDVNFGTLIDSTSSIGQPHKFNFNVPVTGKLVDVRVWVEIVTLSGTNAVGSTGSSGHHVWPGIVGQTVLPLESFGISLRSPNVSWPGHWAHPIMNDPAYAVYPTSTASNNVLDNTISNLRNPPEFYRDSFLIWEPATLFNPTHPDVMRLTIPTWGNDLGMRTVFCDGSKYKNPRICSPGIPVDFNANGAPNVFGQWPSYPGTISGSAGTWQNGNNAPWTTDSGSWGNNSAVLASLGAQAGSPPNGWLTGPGETAGANEWPTTGSNIGAPDLQPVYPFLDAVYQKFTGSIPNWYSGGILGSPIDFLYNDHLTWAGRRPGLRGTEVSGTWTLMFCTPSVSFYSGSAAWTFVRQARLELLYTQNRPVALRRNSGRDRTPTDGAPILLGLISGSGNYRIDQVDVPSEQECFVHATFIESQARPDASFGLSLGTGSNDPTTALVWSLSGAIQSVSGTNPGWLTDNFYGMPAIPASSWSLAVRDPVDPVPATDPFKTIFPRKILDGARTLPIVSRDDNPPKTLDRLAAEFLTGSDN